MHSLNSVATNWQMSEGTVVSEGDRVYDSQEFNRALESKTSFQHLRASHGRLPFCSH